MSIIRELKAQIEQLNKTIEEIQNQCSHPEASLSTTAKSNTGNYDPSADAYWTEYYCGLCEKRWTIDAKK